MLNEAEGPEPEPELRGQMGRGQQRPHGTARWVARTLETVQTELLEGNHGAPHRFVLRAAAPESPSTPDWEVTIDGPRSSLYEGQQFRLTIEFPPEVPFKPPLIKLRSPIYHFSMGAHA
eukprot:SAG31_NODE_19964_length_587_cov_1.127049_1_plen_118_part_01